MQINLRKANALQHAIKERINELQNGVSAAETITPFTTVEGVVEAGNKLVVAFNEAGSLRDVLYEIRKKVSAANSGEIDELLADVAQANEIVAVGKTFVNADIRPSDEEIQKRVEKVSADDNYAYSGMRVGVLNEEMIAYAREEVNRAKKIKVAAQDRLLELNISTKITLSDDQVEILRKHDII